MRLEILPQLQRINPQVRSALIRLSNVAHMDADYLNDRFQLETQTYIEHMGNHVRIDKAAFESWHPAIQVRSIRYSISLIAPEAIIGYKNLMAALETIKSNHVGAIAEFPGKVQLRVDYNSLIVEHQQRQVKPSGWMHLPSDIEIPVRVGQNNVSPDGLWTFKLAQESNGNHTAEICIPENAQILLRTRRPGDRIQPKGLNGHSQKLKKWLIDRKIPQRERDKIPLLLVNQQIAAIFLFNQCYITEFYVTPQLNCIVVYLFTTYKINQ